jgi:hypothetical protein
MGGKLFLEKKKKKIKKFFCFGVLNLQSIFFWLFSDFEFLKKLIIFSFINLLIIKIEFNLDRNKLIINF